MLPFKPHLNAFIFQVSYSLQQIHGIAGKAADGLCKDDVNLSILGIRYELLESFPFLRAGSGDAVIRIHARIFPRRVLLDVLTVMADLRR